MLVDNFSNSDGLDIPEFLDRREDKSLDPRSANELPRIRKGSGLANEELPES